MFIYTLYSIDLFKIANQHANMQIRQCFDANEACQLMLMRKCLLAMLILMHFNLVLILMLLNLCTGYADTDANLGFKDVLVL